jgi:hypothetical protein
MVTYGEFNNSPLTDVSTQVLTKGMTWQQDQSDVINKVLVKYGQGTDYANNYIELPLPIVLEDLYIVDLSGNVGSYYGATTIQINIMYVDITNHAQIYTISKTYSVGATSYDISQDILNDFRGNEYFQILSSGDSLIFVPLTADTKTLWREKNLDISYEWPGGWTGAAKIGEAALSVSLAFASVTGPAKTKYATYATTTMQEDKSHVGFTIEFVGTEPAGFEIARQSQKLNGIRTAKISLPEVLTVSDVLKMSDRIFKKLGKTKYRCTTQCANGDTWQLPLFALYNVKDNTHTKRVLNDEGASIIFIVNGAASTSGVITLAIPSPYAHTPVGVIVSVSAGQTVATILSNIKTRFELATLVGIIATIDNPSNSITFTYGVDIENIAFMNSEAFYQTNIGSSIPTLTFKRVVNPPSQFKEVVFDEYLHLLSYDSDSTKATYSCVFGVPNEDLSNIINQSITWIGDIEKQQ